MTPTHRQPERARGGFTLIELMVVVALTALLSALVAPKFSAWVRSMGADSAADRFATDLVSARAQAIREGRTVTLRLDSAAAYRIVMDSLSAAAPLRQPGSVNLRGDYPGVSITPVPTIVRFDSRGVLRSGESTFTVAHGASRDTIWISGLGRIKRGN